MEGKAKEEMLKWLSANYPLGWKAMEMGGLRPSFQNTLIVEWLDTVKLNVYVVPVKNGWFSCIKNGDNDLTHGLFIDRQSATEAAIKKAVQIFNEKYGNPQGDTGTKQ